MYQSVLPIGFIVNVSYGMKVVVWRMQQTRFDYDIDKFDVKTETYLIKKDSIQNDRDRVYQEIAGNGGTTLKEIADKWGCPPNCISGRITELRQMGYIAADGKRYLPNYKGKMYPHTIWRATL